MLGSTRARNLRTHTQKNASSSSSSPPALALPVASLALTPATIVFSPRARAERAGGRLLGGKAKALGAGSEEQGEQSS